MFFIIISVLVIFMISIIWSACVVSSRCEDTHLDLEVYRVNRKDLRKKNGK